jgi:hypothetical protein
MFSLDRWSHLLDLESTGTKELFFVIKIYIFLKSIGLRPDSNLAKFPDQVPNSDP